MNLPGKKFILYEIAESFKHQLFPHKCSIFEAYMRGAQESSAFSQMAEGSPHRSRFEITEPAAPQVPWRYKIGRTIVKHYTSRAEQFALIASASGLQSEKEKTLRTKLKSAFLMLSMLCFCRNIPSNMSGKPSRIWHKEHTQCPSILILTRHSCRSFAAVSQRR